MDAAKNTISNIVNLYNSAPDFSNSGVKPLSKEFEGPIPPTDSSSSSILPCEPLKIVDGHFVDPHGRKRVLKGINVDTSMKLPVKPFSPSYKGDSSDADGVFFDGDNVSFVGRPFPLEEAEQHWRRIKSWGYNTVRYVLTWEAIEHAGPGKYDDDFVDYTIEMLKVVHKVGGIYVFLESHQDVWSRYSGGSGAPLWTFYAAGLQPTHFHATEAAILHNDPRFDRPTDSECYPRMFWPTNYQRLAASTMFTLYFAGKAYFPHLKINDVNIQDYLQEHHRNALEYLTKKVVAALPELIKDGTILGFESINEPGSGLVGHPNLGEIPESQHFRIDTTPTVYQTFLLGMGLPVEVDIYEVNLAGPKKIGTRVVDPKGVKAWLTGDEFSKYDAHYGWKRSGWNPGQCIFSDLKIWGWKSDLDKLKSASVEERIEFAQSQCQLNEPEYFRKPSVISSYLDGREKPEFVDEEFFLAHFFVDYYLAYKNSVRSVNENFFMLLEPPIFSPPPNLKDDKRGVIDDRTVYAPHFYDLMTLLMKTWNDKFNADMLGISRGEYAHPALGVAVGEKAIRNCIKKQYNAIVKEGKERLGNIPALMTETGIPFDMDLKQAYKNGNYSAQTAALDAFANGLEDSGLHHTYWAYSAINSHEYGDYWNNEDFSFWSPEHHEKIASLDESHEERMKSCYPSEDGVRAPSAVIRPFLVASKGEKTAVEFDINAPKFSLTIDLNDQQNLKSTPTVIFVPKWHFNKLSYKDIYVTAGYVKYNDKLEYLEWYHPEGATGETIIIKKHSGKDEDVSKRENVSSLCTIVQSI